MRSLQLTRVRQRFPRETLPDLDQAIRNQPEWSSLHLPPNARIAVAVGSRGIARIPQIVRATVEMLRGKGARPFIVPAMGSHGGATAEGQLEILAALGVTEQSSGCPIHSSSEVVPLLSRKLGLDLCMDRHAFEADGIVLVNRIKPHTDFHARYESGLVKMAVIGLGKAPLASSIHLRGVRGLKELMPKVAQEFFALGKIILGVGVVENAYDEPMRIAVIPGNEIMAREPELLELARQNMPRLPVEQLDVLMVDRLGKNISGTGLDTNVIGRLKIRGEPEPTSPDITAIVISDVTEESHGNAIGLGLADVITRRLFNKIDFAAMNTNAFTSTLLERGKIPVVADTDAHALEFALRACGAEVLAGAPRIIRIRDTLHLGEICVSAPVLAEISEHAEIEVLGSAFEQLDASGQLRPF